MPGSFQKQSGIDGMGFTQTSSPTSSTNGWPASFQASTAAPRQRHCISPATTGKVANPATNAPAKSVPPEIGVSQMSLPSTLGICSQIQW